VAPVVEEKTEFTVKLTKFDEKSKIKVIKEVRNILPDLKLADVSFWEGGEGRKDGERKAEQDLEENWVKSRLNHPPNTLPHLHRPKN